MKAEDKDKDGWQPVRHKHNQHRLSDEAAKEISKKSVTGHKGTQLGAACSTALRTGDERRSGSAASVGSIVSYTGAEKSRVSHASHTAVVRTAAVGSGHSDSGANGAETTVTRDTRIGSTPATSDGCSLPSNAGRHAGAAGAASSDGPGCSAACNAAGKESSASSMLLSFQQAMSQGPEVVPCAQPGRLHVATSKPQAWQRVPSKQQRSFVMSQTHSTKRGGASSSFASSDAASQAAAPCIHLKQTQNKGSKLAATMPATSGTGVAFCSGSTLQAQHGSGPTHQQQHVSSKHATSKAAGKATAAVPATNAHSALTTRLAGTGHGGMRTAGTDVCVPEAQSAAGVLDMLLGSVAALMLLALLLSTLARMLLSHQTI